MKTKSTLVQFDISKKDAKLIDTIVDRAIALCIREKIPVGDRLNIEMDITAVHRNGNALDLERLLAAKDPDFGHDVFGISRYIDRDTGALTDHFRPRFSRIKSNLRGPTSKRDLSARAYFAKQGHARL